MLHLHPNVRFTTLHRDLRIAICNQQNPIYINASCRDGEERDVGGTNKPNCFEVAEFCPSYWTNLAVWMGPVAVVDMRASESRTSERYRSFLVTPQCILSNNNKCPHTHILGYTTVSWRKDHFCITGISAVLHQLLILVIYIYASLVQQRSSVLHYFARARGSWCRCGAERACAERVWRYTLRGWRRRRALHPWRLIC